MQSEKALAKIIDEAAGYLYKVAFIDEKTLHVYWEEGDVRGTSLALLTLYELGEPQDSLLVHGAFKWLEAQLKDEKYGSKTVGRAWEAQVWDTSIALTAFKRIRNKNKPDVEKWLHQVRSLNNRRPTWHDEPWETCFAATALVEPPTGDCSWLPATLDWLNSQLVQVNGAWSLHDNYHYTALYLLLMESLKENAQQPRLLEFMPRLDLSREEGCLCYLIQGLQSEGLLWSGEVWLNAYCLLALVKADRLPSQHEDKCIKWFKEHSHRGAFGSIEDTALATQALYELYLRIGQRELMRKMNEGVQKDKEDIATWAAKSGRGKRSAMQWLRARRRFEWVIAPPNIHTTRPDGSIVFYLSNRNKNLVKGLGVTIATIILTTVVVKLLGIVPWPF